MRFVYVCQFGAFWRLSDAQWKHVLELGARGEGFDFDEVGRRLKQKPAWVRKNEHNSRYWSVRGDIRFFQPLDWTDADFQEQLHEEGLSSGS
ncbi:hypothetical protein DOMOVOI_01760 [Brevundimonas phage vB_BpoS-Domovoi]|uniref:Uncharacterized protein n=1 Tax=Brevundimonas phage vB_BpoS-Domovoi TaxID=2948598 RepID=A0A9E7SK79_9CAUD|nr:hypothetical protein DOMOVOI_01760 [Brevundimonas phage vB_BpoS-Domovoi]